jgi:hypothetical protein
VVSDPTALSSCGRDDAVDAIDCFRRLPNAWNCCVGGVLDGGGGICPSDMYRLGGAVDILLVEVDDFMVVADGAVVFEIKTTPCFVIHGRFCQLLLSAVKQQNDYTFFINFSRG